MNCLKFILIGFVFTIASTARAQEITAYTELLTPYQTLDDNNQLAGFAPFVIKALTAKANDTVNIQVLPWERAYRNVKQQPNTLIFSIYRAPFREKEFSWVGKLDDNIHYFYALRDNVPSHVKTEPASKKLITAVVSNAYEDKQLSARGYNNLMRISSQKQMINMLFSHRVDLLFGSEVTIANLVTAAGKSTDDLIRLFPMKHWGDGLYIAFNKNSDAKLVKRYQNAFQELLNDGTIAKLKKEHFKFSYIPQ